MRIMNIVLRFLCLVGVGIIASGANAFAEIPEAPVELQVKVAYETSQGALQAVAHLYWSPSKHGGTPIGYNIYQGVETDPNAPGQFRKIASTEKTEFNVEGLGNAPVYFYVTAYNADGESKPSNMVGARGDTTNSGGQTPSIVFTSTPNREGFVGQLYLYDADAISKKGDVRYRLTGSPLGAPIPEADATIDPITGLVRWVPTSEGSYVIAIQAYLASDTTDVAMQVVVVSVTTPPCAIIVGKVIDADTYAQIPNGAVVAMAATGSGDPNTGGAIYKAPIIDGSYKLNVPEGEYIVWANAAGYNTQWYKYAASADAAEHIQTACGQDFGADFHMTALPKPVMHVVSGRVTAKVNGDPVMATVEFVTAKNAIDPSTGTVTKGAFATRTDADGYYKIELPDNLIVVAHATPLVDKYLPQYYDGVSNPTEAKPISVSGDVSGIDFALEMRPVYDNGLGGTVHDSLGMGLRGKVLAIMVGENNGKPNGTAGKGFTAAVETDSTGSYRFTNLLPGEYLLLAVPADRNYVPGYYTSSGLAALSWQEATHVSVGEVMLTIQYDIQLRPRNGAKGTAKLSGTVNLKPGSAKIGGITQSGDVLAGVFVYALDEKGLVSDYTFSDANGYFELTELGVGDYTVVADKAGYATLTVVETMDNEENADVRKDLDMSSQQPSGVEETASEMMQLAIYPNPVSSRLTLRFAGTAGTAAVTIVDATGRAVSTSRIASVEGQNSLTIDVDGLATGVYFVRIENGASTSARPFSVVR